MRASVKYDKLRLASDHSGDNVRAAGAHHPDADHADQRGAHQAGEGQDEGVRSAGREIRGGAPLLPPIGRHTH